MDGSVYLIIDVVIVLLIIGGIGIFRTPPLARRGSMLATVAMLCAIAAVLVRIDVNRAELLAIALVVGGLSGVGVALRVSMIQIPAMVAFQHGAGGMAAFLVCFVELSRGAQADLGVVPAVAGLAGLVVGAGTFSASLVAAGKLAGILSSKPIALAGHNVMLLVLAAGTIVAASLAGQAEGAALAALMSTAVVVMILLGIGVSVRVGGADMPVLISTLNATAGFAAAFSGIILGSYLLVAAGATVAASGSVLTHVMCKAMNRKLRHVLTGIRYSQPAGRAVPGTAALGPVMAGAGAPDRVTAGADAPGAVVPEAAALGTAASGSAASGSAASGSAASGSAALNAAAVGAMVAGEATLDAAASGAVDDARVQAAPADEPPPPPPLDPLAAAAEVLRNVHHAILVPGYGMALAQAQAELVALGRKLEANGARVSYAIHPVAGRMPGHMHVLLAEADVPYDRLVEMNDINDQFKSADVAVVVGACDVVNPAAVQSEGTPISGMPILRVIDAKNIVVCNYDDKPGYSGVTNPLYDEEKAILLWGDAKKTLNALNNLLATPTP